MDEKMLKRIKGKKEVWKPVKGYEGLYEVSSTGRIYGKFRKIILEPTMHQPSLKFRMNLNKRPPYLKVGLSKNGISKNYRVHRLVAEAFLDNPEDKPHVNHINSIPFDNRVQNLEWCTPQENMQHSHELRKKEAIKKEKILGITEKGQLLLSL
jgi:hypothetical protein